jgi:hypothetical protein
MSAGERSRAAVPRVALYLDPPSHHFLRDRLFEATTNPLSGHDPLLPFQAVREHFERRGVPVHTADRIAGGPGEIKLYVSFGLWQGLGQPDIVPSALFALECPIVEPSLYRALPKLQRRFRRLFTLTDAPALLPFTRQLVESRTFRFPQSNDRVEPASWEQRDRRFLAMMNANKLPRLDHAELYSERRRAVAYFGRFGEIDLYGPHWGKAPRRVGLTWLPTTLRRLGERLWEARQSLWPDPEYAACAAAHRGIAPSKLRTLANYRFVLCFENVALDGWITEKIFDCFAAGAVPIYLGAPDISSLVPEDCFVDFRRFRDYGELRKFLHALTPAELEGYRERARAYLESERFDPFRVSTFVERFRQIVHEDAGIDS